MGRWSVPGAADGCAQFRGGLIGPRGGTIGRTSGRLGPFMRRLTPQVVAQAGRPHCHLSGPAAHQGVNAASKGAHAHSPRPARRITGLMYRRCPHEDASRCHHLLYRLSRTRKPKSRATSNTHCPITPTGRGELSNENSPRPGLVNDGDKASNSEALNPRVPRGAHGVRVGDQLIEAQVGNVDDLAEREASLAGGGVLDAAPARGQ